MLSSVQPLEWILGCLLILSSLGVIIAQKPVHASLSFLMTLILLAVFYLRLSAPFIAVMQVLVYAGAILVIFMFVIILFQDAHQQLSLLKPKISPVWLSLAALTFLLSLILLGKQLVHFELPKHALPANFGEIHSIGETLYLDFFFPFEAIIVVFLVAVVGALYIGRKTKS
jgi:NADH-quinone oxidoreductase subunit J